MSEQVEGQLTLFPEDFLASLSPLPGSKEARRMTATSGQKWLGLSKNYGPLGLLEKMLLESSIWHSQIYYLNWKPKDIGQGHFLFQLALLEPTTGDTESQLWATPTAMDHMAQRSEESLRKMAAGSRRGRKRPSNLREQVDPKNMMMWPTPRAKESGDYQYSQGNHEKKTLTLSGAVKMYNTPTAQDAKNSTLPKSQINRDSLVGDVMREQFATPQARDYRTGQASRWEDKEHRSRNLNDQIAMYPTPRAGGSNGSSESGRKHGDLAAKIGGQLNPMWVEWLMGYPIGWTELDAWETQ